MEALCACLLVYFLLWRLWVWLADESTEPNGKRAGDIIWAAVGDQNPTPTPTPSASSTVQPANVKLSNFLKPRL